jgi:hypothetical protein
MSEIYKSLYKSNDSHLNGKFKYFDIVCITRTVKSKRYSLIEPKAKVKVKVKVKVEVVVGV